MPRFRKKPVEIDAIRWTGQNYSEVCAFVGQEVETIERKKVLLVIATLEGTMLASPGDWIVRGAPGEFCVYKPDIFDATYEPVTEKP